MEKKQKKKLSTTKKLLIGIGAGVGVLAVLIVVYVFVILGRVQHVSLDEAREQAEQSLASGESAELLIEASPLPVAANDSDFSDDLIDASDVNLSDVPQTELNEEDTNALLKDFNPDVVNVLLMGVDRRGSKGVSRADTMFIATLDKPNKKLKLSSLMRDMYVPIPDHGEQRINVSTVYGGPGLAIDTINSNFSMDLEYYVSIDFRMFEKMVDALGGITMTLTAGEVSAANDCIAGLNKQRGVEDIRKGFITKAGSVQLNGTQALGYARIRHYGNGDYQRTNRQFKVLLTIFNKFKKMGLVKQQKVIYDILPFVETNLSSTQILDMALSVLSLDTEEVLHYRLPVDGAYQSRMIKGMAVLLPDINANAVALHEFIFRMTDSPIQKESLAVGTIGTYVPPPPLDATPAPEDPLQQQDVPQDPAQQGQPTPSPTPSPTPAPMELPSIFDAVTPAPDDMFKPLF